MDKQPGHTPGNIPKIVIAGTHSGCGKTTVAIGIMAALVRKGLLVQPFKVGPDYLDPMLHTFITRRSCGNLDSWLVAGAWIHSLFIQGAEGADVAVIEGVMGLYDGLGGYSLQGSTAQVARLLSAPVILVVNGEGISLSLAALIKGYRDFSPRLRLRGVIINRVKTERHYRLLKESVEKHTGLPVLGYLLPQEQYQLPSRHLGLLPSDEIADLQTRLDTLAAQTEATIDLEALLRIAGARDEGQESAQPSDKTSVPALSIPALSLTPPASRQPVIAVARDKAFNFYYQANLDLLAALGARLVFFSPLHDRDLPADIDGLYIGGGYPEVFAGQLQDNQAFREAVRRHIVAGLPAYAECGGLLYMCESLEDTHGRVYSMAGLIPGKSRMTARLQRFGYVHVEATADNVLAQKGFRIRGHEFHYALTEIDEQVERCWQVTKAGRTGRTYSWACGYKVYNLLAGYPHLHFGSNIEFAKEFVKNCLHFKKQKTADVQAGQQAESRKDDK